MEALATITQKPLDKEDVGSGLSVDLTEDNVEFWELIKRKAAALVFPHLTSRKIVQMIENQLQSEIGPPIQCR